MDRCRYRSGNRVTFKYDLGTSLNCIKKGTTMSNFEQSVFDAFKEALDELVPTEQPKSTPDEMALVLEELKKLKNQIAELTAAKPAAFKPKKNHVTGAASPTRVYKLLTKQMPSWGKVPQQQADLATILSNEFETDVEYTEKQVFDLLISKACWYDSLAKSKQDPTYLFRYYRGLKMDTKYAGFIARGFLRMTEKEEK